MSLVLFSSPLVKNDSFCSPVLTNFDGDAYGNWRLSFYVIAAMIASNFLLAVLTYVELLRMKLDMHSMQKDATEGGKIMYKAVIALKAAVSKLTDMVFEDVSSKGLQFGSLVDKTNVDCAV